MFKFFNHFSIKNKILFGLVIVMLISLGIGIVEYNRIVKIDYIYKENLLLDSYRSSFSRLINFYNKLGLSSVEIVNTTNQDNYIKQVNSVKNFELELSNIYSSLESVDLSKTNDEFLLNNLSLFSDSIFIYNQIYTDKIKIAIDQLISYKYLTLHPEQIEEDYKALMIEQENIGAISSDFSNRTKEEIILELSTIYENSIQNLKISILNNLSSQEFIFDKLIFNIQKEKEINNNFILKVKTNVLKISVILFFISLILVIFLIFIISNTVTLPLIESNRILEKISKGYIPDKLNIERSDEIGLILESINNLITHLKQTVIFAQEISDSNFEYEFVLSGSDDVLGNSLIKLRESLIHAKKEEEKRKIDDQRRNRENEGISTFSEILRQNQNNLKNLGREVISNLVKFLKANQGVIFVLDGDEKETYLNLISAYAWNREKFIEKRIAIGEGLIGSVADEKFSVYMTDVPEDYIEIKSGTGSANPKSILIVPLKVDQEVLGVIEVASFNEIESYEIKIVEHIAEDIASTLKSVRVSDQTSELLEKFQIQASEMKEQEMALKETIEELQNTYQDRKNREDELAKKLKEINELNKQIQFKDEQLQKEVEKLSNENVINLRKIEHQSENLIEIIEKMFINVFIIKKGGEIEFVNKSTESLLNSKKQDLQGLNIDEIIVPPINLGKEKLCEYLFVNLKEINNEGGRNFFLKNKDEQIIKVLIELAIVGIEDDQRLVLFVNNETENNTNINYAQDFVNNTFKNDFEKTLKIDYYENFLKENNITVPQFIYNEKEIIQWGPKFMLGVDLIDTQHKKWIYFINKFFYSLISKDDDKKLSDTLVELKEYTEFHFSFEEKYMNEFSYNDLNNHKIEHKKFIDTLNEYFSEYISGDYTTIQKIVYFLREWVYHHVLTTDVKYVELFKKHGIK